MLTTITASLLIGASTGLLFNVRMVMNLSIAAVAVCCTTTLLGLTAPSSAALYAIAAIISLQVGYLVSLIIAALGLADEPSPIEDKVQNEAQERPSAPLALARSKRRRS
jgi:hypothetical protein